MVSAAAGSSGCGYPIPGPLALLEFDRFLAEPPATRHAVVVEDLEPAAVR